MIKRLHWLILKSFIGPFMATFIIAMFVLIMQFLWKYIDDLMGKGLDFEIVMELLLYASADLIPMALPLALLLSSIMVLGKFGELNELTAMKSAGLSLFRIILPLTTIVVAMSIGAFFFSNYTWPSAHFQMRVLINDIQGQKTALLINENEYYNGIDGYSIKVEEKIDDSHFKKVFIADHNGQNSYKWREIYAESAEMQRSKDGATLLVTLEDGFTDEELHVNATGLGEFPFRHTDFGKLKIAMDLSNFTLDRTDKNGYRESILFKNYWQLTEDVDSMHTMMDFRLAQTIQNAKNKLFLFRDSNLVSYDTVQSIAFNPDTLETGLLNVLVNSANNNLRRSKQDLSNHKVTILEPANEMLVHVNMARNKIFTLSIAILVLFFIGAPLGVDSKKGGIGYPVVVALVFFIVYYMLLISGEKMAFKSVLSPFWGMWLSSIILAPIALFLTMKANSDSVLFDTEFYKKLVKKRSK